MKRFLALLAMVSTILTAFSVQCFAGNTSNEIFAFRLPAEGFYTVSQLGAEKKNNSSTYVDYLSANTGHVYFSVHGYDNSIYTDIRTLTNCTIGDSAIIYPGQQRRIRQLVYERGFPYAFLGGAPSTGIGNTLICGYWNPDCSGNYPAAN